MPAPIPLFARFLAGLLCVSMSSCTWLPETLRRSEQSADAEISRTRPAVDGDGVVSASPLTDDIVKRADSNVWRLIGSELRLSPLPQHRHADPLLRFGGVGLINEAVKNSRPFLAHIYEEIVQRQLPLEIILVPIIESAYNPAATSPSGAAGIWQFMPATGKRFGLVQSRWYDGRRDILQSTKAALQYFELLRDRFMGDWQLVFAAYNCGERTVERAIERNTRLGLATDFHALELPSATKNYVPKLYALIEIIADPEAWGVSLESVPLDPYFKPLEVGPQLDLNRVINWSGMTAAEFDHLNAGFRKRLTVTGAPTVVLLPRDRFSKVEQALASLPQTARGKAREHIVKSGETLSHIAANTAIPVHVLKRANGLKSSRLAVGQRLLIPGPEALRHATADLPATTEPASPAFHTVVAGDTLWDIARAYNTSVAELCRRNDISRRQGLKPGQRLALPGRAPATTKPHREDSASNKAHYEVRNGDSLWTISRRFKVSVADLKRWNNLTNRSLLQPGQRLLIQAPQTSASGMDI